MAATGPVVLGEHDFEEESGPDPYDPYGGGQGQMQWPTPGGPPTRAHESRAVAIAIGVFVAVVLVIAAVILIFVFSGGNDSSGAGDPTKTSTVGTATKNTLVPVALSPQEAALAAQVSEGFRDTCVGAPGAIAGSTAAITCTPGVGAAKVTYASFADRTALEAAYDQSLAQFGVNRSTGVVAPAAPCANQRVEEVLWSYSTDPNQPAEGRYLCGPLNKNATITWTAWNSNILATAERGDLDLKTLGYWWLKSGGPYLPE